MDATRVLNASLNGAVSGAAVYLIGRASGYRFPAAAAAVVGTAVGVGRYRTRAGIDLEAIEDEARTVAEELEQELDENEVPVAVPGEGARPRRRTAVLASAVEHAMGFDDPKEREPSD